MFLDYKIQLVSLKDIEKLQTRVFIHKTGLVITICKHKLKHRKQLKLQLINYVSANQNRIQVHACLSINFESTEMLQLLILPILFRLNIRKLQKF